ncbi:hypothetical protein Dimus_014552 [Dionaea muscipula]
MDDKCSGTTTTTTTTALTKALDRSSSNPEDDGMKLVASDVADGGSTTIGSIRTPERLKVPKAFKYPERYMSPTDHMISPVSKGILSRGRRADQKKAILSPSPSPAPPPATAPSTKSTN